MHVAHEECTLTVYGKTISVSFFMSIVILNLQIIINFTFTTIPKNCTKQFAKIPNYKYIMLPTFQHIRLIS